MEVPQDFYYSADFSYDGLYEMGLRSVRAEVTQFYKGGNGEEVTHAIYTTFGAVHLTFIECYKINPCVLGRANYRVDKWFCGQPVWDRGSAQPRSRVCDERRKP